MSISFADFCIALLTQLAAARRASSADRCAAAAWTRASSLRTATRSEVSAGGEERSAAAEAAAAGAAAGAALPPESSSASDGVTGPAARVNEASRRDPSAPVVSCDGGGGSGKVGARATRAEGVGSSDTHASGAVSGQCGGRFSPVMGVLPSRALERACVGGGVAWQRESAASRVS